MALRYLYTVLTQASSKGAPNARVSQAFTEVLAQGTPNARISQVFVEVLVPWNPTAAVTDVGFGSTASVSVGGVITASASSGLGVGSSSTRITGGVASLGIEFGSSVSLSIARSVSASSGLGLASRSGLRWNKSASVAIQLSLFLRTDRIGVNNSHSTGFAVSALASRILRRASAPSGFSLSNEVTGRINPIRRSASNIITFLQPAPTRRGNWSANASSSISFGQTSDGRTPIRRVSATSLIVVQASLFKFREVSAVSNIAFSTNTSGGRPIRMSATTNLVFQAAATDKGGAASRIVFGSTAVARSGENSNLTISFGSRAIATVVFAGAFHEGLMAGNSARFVIGAGSGKFPNSYAVNEQGQLFIANGIDPMRVWDGHGAVREAGVPSPASAPTIDHVAGGTIRGKFWVYPRYIDRYGNESAVGPKATITLGSNGLIRSIYRLSTRDAAYVTVPVYRRFLKVSDGTYHDVGFDYDMTGDTYLTDLYRQWEISGTGRFIDWILLNNGGALSLVEERYEDLRRYPSNPWLYDQTRVLSNYDEWYPRFPKVQELSFDDKYKTMASLYKSNKYPVYGTNAGTPALPVYRGYPQIEADAWFVAHPTTAKTWETDGTVTISEQQAAELEWVILSQKPFVDHLPEVRQYSSFVNKFSDLSGSETLIVWTNEGHGIGQGDSVQIQNIERYGVTGIPEGYKFEVIAGFSRCFLIRNPFTLVNSNSSTYKKFDAALAGKYEGDGATWSSGAKKIVYSNLPVPSDSKIAKIQMLRNTDGQANVFYVDGETTDFSPNATIESTKTDVDLRTQTAVPLFGSDGMPYMYRAGMPTSSSCSVVSHLGRMWAAGHVSYDEGHVTGEIGSTLVSGVGTEWPSSFETRRISFYGGDQEYVIKSVDVANQTLTLDKPLGFRIGKFTKYAIKPNRATSRIVYYTESGKPEQWPVWNGMPVAENGDEIVGLITFDSFLYVVEKAHIHRLTLKDNPAVDGAIFLAVRRGAVNIRCVAIDDDGAYMLDESGVHLFDGRKSVSISTPIQDLFRKDRIDGELRINWSADRRLWHAVSDPQSRIVRFFVSMSGDGQPRHAVCFNAESQSWHIEEYPVPITASAIGQLGVDRCLGGTTARRIVSIGDSGSLVDLSPESYAVGGIVGSCGPISLTDNAVSFAPELAGCSVSVVSGRGVGQSRLIVSVTESTLLLDRPWMIRPDSTSRYQINAINWRWQSKRWRLNEDDESNEQGVSLVFTPTKSVTTVAIKYLFDFSRKPYLFGYTRTQDGVSVRSGDPQIVVDLSTDSGYARCRIDRFREITSHGKRFAAIDMSGFQGTDPVSISQVSVGGAG
jgi:hypothetical protein